MAASLSGSQFDKILGVEPGELGKWHIAAPAPCNTTSPFYQHELTLIPHGWVMTYIEKYAMKLLIHSQNSKFALSKFGNG